MMIIIISSVSLYSVFTAAWAYNREIREINQSLKTELRNEEKKIESIIFQLQSQALQLAVSMSMKEEVLEAYRIEPLSEAQAHLKKSISAEIEAIRSSLGYSQLKIHFHKMGALSFLREWNGTGGDELASFRGSVLHVQENAVPLRCVELGKGGLAIRGIAPVMYMDQAVGSVEVFFEIYDIIKAVKAENPELDFIVIADKDQMDALLFSEEKQLYYQNILENYVVIENTLSSEEVFKEEIKPVIERGLDTDSDVMALNRVHLTNIEIPDFSGKKIGNFIFIYDKSAQIVSTSIMIAAVTLINLFSGIFIIILVSAAFNRTKRQFDSYNEQLQTEIDLKNRFFTIISHDLRAPFNALLGFSKLLLSGEISEDQKTGFIEAIHESSTQGLELLENLLQWSNEQTNRTVIKIENYNLHRIARKTVKLMSFASEKKNISLNMDIDEDIEIVFDKDCLELILRNLISNAVKFTNRDGRIKLTAELRGQTVLCSVEDNGIGMSVTRLNELRSSIRPRGSRGTENEGGAGIGLMLVKEFASKCGGQLFIESEEGRGSKFTFSAQAADSDA